MTVVATIASAMLMVVCLVMPATAMTSVPNEDAAYSAEVRIASNPWFWGERMLYPNQRKNAESIFEYYRTLGYTHVLYGMPPPTLKECFFRDSAGGEVQWRYRPGNADRYRTGPIAESLAHMLQLAHRYNLRVIPHVNPLSHAHAWIGLDSTTSEIRDWEGFCGGCTEDRNNNGKPDHCRLQPQVWCNEINGNHVTFVGAYPEIRNEPVDQIFAEYIRIIRAVWESSPGTAKEPDYIHIGHDEPGSAGLGFIGLDRSRPLLDKWSRSQLLAKEIAWRIRRITNILDGEQTRIMVFGDALVPADYGEIYDLCGDTRTGKGGVLWHLAQMGARERLVVMPWMYSLADGMPRIPAGTVLFDKEIQLRYLDMLGYDYVIAGGEDYEPRRIEAHEQCHAEWLWAAAQYPKHCRGFANLTWVPFDLCNDNGCVGYTLPLLAYLGWIAPPALGDVPLSARKFQARFMREPYIDYMKSIREKAWVKSKHFAPHPFQSPGSSTADP